MFCCGIGLYMVEWALVLAGSVLIDRHINPNLDYRVPKIIFWIMALPLQAMRTSDLEPKDAYDFATIVMYGMLNYFAIRYCLNWYRKRKHRTDVQQDYDDATKTGRQVS